jgi:hypothetical protein
MTLEEHKELYDGLLSLAKERGVEIRYYSAARSLMVGESARRLNIERLEAALRYRHNSIELYR